MLLRTFSAAVKGARAARRLLRLAMREFRLDTLGQVWLAKPTTLNLLINDGILELTSDSTAYKARRYRLRF